MSTRYKLGDIVPSSVLWPRLQELSSAISQYEREDLLRELTMCIPAELDRDADCVIAEAGRRLRDMVPRPADEWNEDIGEAIWFRHPCSEPPHIGSPMEDSWTERGYHKTYTHFIPLHNWMFEVESDATRSACHD